MFQTLRELGKYHEDLYAVKLRFKDKKAAYYPCTLNDNELFVYGKGRVKINKKPKEKVEYNFTAEDIKKVYDKYGVNVALGCVNGWGNYNLFDDRSEGLKYVKPEIYTWITYGKKYDEFLNKLHSLNDMIIEKFKENKFVIESKCLIYKGNEDKFIGFVDRDYDINIIHYIDHHVGASIFMSWAFTGFDPITFEYTLDKIYRKLDKEFDDNMSVSDKIDVFLGAGMGNKVAEIFDWQTEMDKEINTGEIIDKEIQ